MMNHEREDQEFERYLDGDSVESRRYAGLGDEQPPADLDARILADAERAVKITQLPTRRAPPFKAFAWAAIVVLSFSLVLNILFEEMPRDPVAELERLAGRSDSPIKPAASPLPESRTPARKAERMDTGRAAVAKDGLVEVPAQKQSMEAEAGDDLQMAMTPPHADEAAADKRVVYEQSIVARRVEAKTAAPAVEPITVEVINLGRARTPPMQLLADYFAEPARANRVQALSSATPADNEADAELRRILDSYDDDFPDEAMTALADFRAKYPTHPVSVALADGGF